MRYEARKRFHMDGRTWWCVWDNKHKCWSTLTCFWQYPTKKSCVEAIELATKLYGEYIEK